MDQVESLITPCSVQRFVPNAKELTNIPVEQLDLCSTQELAICDLLTGNCERNPGNLLVEQQEGMYVLKAIDNTILNPTYLDAHFHFAWAELPQLAKPVADKLKQKVISLSEEDLLRQMDELRDQMGGSRTEQLDREFQEYKITQVFLLNVLKAALEADMTQKKLLIYIPEIKAIFGKMKTVLIAYFLILLI